MPDAVVKDGPRSTQGLDAFPKLKDQRQIYFDAMPEICTERPELVTGYHVKHNLLNKSCISVLDKAKAYRHALRTRQPVVRHTCARNYEKKSFDIEDRSPFAGSTTSKFKGVPIYPELIGLILWPDLLSLKHRPSNPFFITEEQIEKLNMEVFPHWMDNSILELTRETYYGNNTGPLATDEIKQLQNLVFYLTSKPLCISHTIPDFSRAVREGLRAIINEARTNEKSATTDEHRKFYLAIQEALEGIIEFSKNLAAKAQLMASDGPVSGDSDELRRIAEIYWRVPEQPATTFREGLTTVWLCWIAVHLENPNVGMSLGRLDQVLWDLYRKDREAGRISFDDAVELVSHFWLKMGDHVPTMTQTAEELFGGTGANQAITVGGVDKDTNDAVNELTYVILKAAELMQLRDPNLNARYYPGKNSEDYLSRLCAVNLKTCATPAIHHDRAIIKALHEHGDSLEQALDYGIVGCVEPCSAGRTYGHNGAILLNLASVLEFTLYNGKHRRTGTGPADPVVSKPTGAVAGFADFAIFMDAFNYQLAWIADRAATLNNRLGEIHQKFYPTPILSALFEGPMASGMDVTMGGAEINASGVAVIALADVADSLSAIKHWVYEHPRVSWQDLLAALASNFGENGLYYDKIDAMYKSNKALRTLLADQAKTPKYGNNDPSADGIVRDIMEELDNLFKHRPNYRGGFYRVGYWTMTIHAAFGRLTKALPNGRMAHENFSSGITPVSGVTPSLPQALNSAAGLPAAAVGSGVALNLKFTPDDGDPSVMLDNFASYVEGFFDTENGSRDGGIEIQFNVTDHEKFIKAVKTPELYKDLLVRVSGYTAYFKDLNPRMQKEIIDRTEYRLSTGKMVYYPPFPLSDEQ